MTNHRERVQESTNSSERFGGWRKLAAIGALSTIALTGCASNVDAKPSPSETSVTAEPTETTQATPSPGETGPSETEVEARVQELQMPAGLSDEELAATYIDRYNQWLNAGTEDPDALNERFMNDEEHSLAELAQIVAEEQAEIYAPALLGPDWQSNPDAVETVDNMIFNNTRVLNHFMQTEWNDPATNPEGYRAWIELDSSALISPTDVGRDLEIRYTAHDNSDKNVVEDGSVLPLRGLSLTPTWGNISVRFATVDGAECITDID